jgi:hypothetical protein
MTGPGFTVTLLALPSDDVDLASDPLAPEQIEGGGGAALAADPARGPGFYSGTATGLAPGTNYTLLLSARSGLALAGGVTALVGALVPDTQPPSFTVAALVRQAADAGSGSLSLDVDVGLDEPGAVAWALYGDPACITGALEGGGAWGGAIGRRLSDAWGQAGDRQQARARGSSAAPHSCASPRLQPNLRRLSCARAPAWRPPASAPALPRTAAHARAARSPSRRARRCATWPRCGGRCRAAPTRCCGTRRRTRSCARRHVSPARGGAAGPDLQGLFPLAHGSHPSWKVRLCSCCPHSPLTPIQTPARAPPSRAGAPVSYASRAHTLYLLAEDDLPTFRGWTSTCAAPALSPAAAAAPPGPCARVTAVACRNAPPATETVNAQAPPFAAWDTPAAAGAAAGGAAPPARAPLRVPIGVADATPVAFTTAALTAVGGGGGARALVFSFALTRPGLVRYYLVRDVTARLAWGMLPVFAPGVVHNVSISRDCGGGPLEAGTAYGVWFNATDVYGAAAPLRMLSAPLFAARRR